MSNVAHGKKKKNPLEIDYLISCTVIVSTRNTNPKGKPIGFVITRETDPQIRRRNLIII